MGRKHLLSLPLLLAAGCFEPDNADDTVGVDTAPATTDPSTGAESGETETTPDESESSMTTAHPPETESEGESVSESDTEVDPTTETGADTTAPTVVSVSPEAGAGAIASDASIVISFSEPMDRTSTEAAWQSDDIRGVAMSWSEDDTVLTIVPNDPLVYASGSDIDAVDANEYAFTLAVTATDAAGNALDAELSSNFFTMRRIELTLAPIATLTGMTYPDGAINDLNVQVGDVQGDTQQKGVFSFTLPGLPAGATIARAAVYADQTVVGGDPYGVLPALGEIHLMDVEFETEWDVWDADALADLGTFSDDATLETKTLDVTDAIADDYAAGLASTQFRLEFPVATNGNGILDRCTFDKPTVGLDLSYLVE